MRRFGVEEELLIVDAETLAPAPVAEAALASAESANTAHELTAEFKQEQIEVVSPPQATLDDQIRAIRTGRELAEAAVGGVGGRLLALPVFPVIAKTTLSKGERYHAIGEELGFATFEHLTCGFHVHVEVGSREEGVAVLDRIRPWLPTILALSANSPFWQGVDTGYGSYRYQVMSRLPATGPTELFGSAAEYERHCAQLLDSGVLLDEGMLYFDARLSARFQTVEVRVADISMSAHRAGVIAGLIRALVETAVRRWRNGTAAPDLTTGVLRIWTWQASRWGVEADLVDPTTGRTAPARDVVARLLAVVRPVLEELREWGRIEAEVADILGGGSGARAQREAFAGTADIREVVRRVLSFTHR